jgi:hypothetical protein
LSNSRIVDLCLKPKCYGWWQIFIFTLSSLALLFFYADNNIYIYRKIQALKIGKKIILKTKQNHTLFLNIYQRITFKYIKFKNNQNLALFSNISNIKNNVPQTLETKVSLSQHKSCNIHGPHHSYSKIHVHITPDLTHLT